MMKVRCLMQMKVSSASGLGLYKIFAGVSLSALLKDARVSFCTLQSKGASMKRIALGIALSILTITASARSNAADKQKSAEAQKPAEGADAQKTVTLSGQIGCGHCAFNVAKSCTDVIRVKENGKDVIYFFTDDPSRKHDTAMCETVRNGKVTGVVGEKDGKKTLKVSKIEFAK
jgi:hypothetical protein